SGMQDSFVVTFVGTPSEASPDLDSNNHPLFSAAQGIWTMTVTKSKTDDTWIPGHAVPVVQVGESIGGMPPIVHLRMNDPLSRTNSNDPRDHQLAFWASTSNDDSQQMIVRATMVTGGIAGTVTDGYVSPNGAGQHDGHNDALPGVKVALFQNDVQVSVDRAADSDGKYSFNGLAPGWYQVRAWLRDNSA